MDSKVALKKGVSIFKECTQKLEDFLTVQNKAFSKLSLSVKLHYDFGNVEFPLKNSNSLPELVTEGFDEEQIWQQLEIWDNENMPQTVREISQILAKKESLTLNESEDVDSDSENEDEEIPDGSDDESLSNDSESEGKTKTSNLKKPRGKPSIVDDQFFKLRDLDAYLTKEDEKEFRKDNKKNEDESDDDDDDDDDESIDLFNDLSDEEDDEDARNLKYADFFDSPDNEDEQKYNDFSKKDRKRPNPDEDESEDEEDFDMDDEQHQDASENLEKVDQPTKKVKFNLDNENLEESENESINSEEDNLPKSTLEEREQRLQKRIQELEKGAIAEKPWQMKGEARASIRPQNSMLEEHLECDIVTRPAPVITEKITKTLEDIIRSRIKDKVWDDVIKKQKPVEAPTEYKKKLVMNQEKSKESLAQIYEAEYLKQKAEVTEKKDEQTQESKEHIEIRGKMHALFRKLDALSNFHYTPKPAVAEVKIVSNVPAINMEEVAPVATSDATMLAPEEIKKKQRGDLIGKSERTKTDMKRSRRRKKAHQRAVQKEKEQKDKAALAVPEQKKFSKKKNCELVKQLTKARNIVQMDETSDKKAPKSSTAFFTQLQDQVSSHIKAKKTGESKSKKMKNTHSAAKLKF